MKKYDAIIIGAGQAGVPLAKKLAQAGWKTLLVEKRLIGGTCVNDGCTPTKTLIASARLAYLAAKGKDLGIRIPEWSADMAAIKKRKDQIVASSRKGSETGLKEVPGLDLIFGQAAFSGHKTVRITGKKGKPEEFTADKIFIDTGAKPSIPEIEGLQNIPYLTSTSILDLEEVPKHLLILGASYIALELGQLYRRLGSKVTMLEREAKFLVHEDEDVAEELKKILETEGITIHQKAEATRLASGSEKQIQAQLRIDGKVHSLTCSHVLVATGRTPQTADLNLDTTGVQTDEKGHILVNDQLETKVAGIYALGDVKGGPAFTHIAYNDYVIVRKNLLEKASLSIKDRLVPYCIFTDPQLGRVGLSEQQARQQGYSIQVVKLPMERVARAIETGDTRGFMKAIVDQQSKQILGASILGTEGGELISVLQMAMMGGLTYEQIRFSVFAHPTFAESLNNLFMTLEE